MDLTRNEQLNFGRSNNRIGRFCVTSHVFQIHKNLSLSDQEVKSLAGHVLGQQRFKVDGFLKHLVCGLVAPFHVEGVAQGHRAVDAGPLIARSILANRVVTGPTYAFAIAISISHDFVSWAFGSGTETERVVNNPRPSGAGTDRSGDEQQAEGQPAVECANPSSGDMTFHQRPKAIRQATQMRATENMSICPGCENWPSRTAFVPAPAKVLALSCASCTWVLVSGFEVLAVIVEAPNDGR